MSESRAFYNENDKKAAAWLRELINEGLIAPGDVDERSIVDVRASDIRGYTQCHWFAGIGGWSAAFRLAGIPDTAPVWSASCPCQPLSSAGQRKEHVDERHLWPAFFPLLAECRPATCFGEQAGDSATREWFSGIRLDMETVGYACGAADLCSAGVKAPHKRQRLYWVAHAAGERRGETWSDCLRSAQRYSPGSLQTSGLADDDDARLQTLRIRDKSAWRSAVGATGDGVDTAQLGDTPSPGSQGEWGEYRPSGERHSGLVGLAMQAGVPKWNGPTVAVLCSDGPRRISAQSNAFPLAHGVSARVGKLRGAGNAINPILAAEFVKAFLETQA